MSEPQVVDEPSAPPVSRQSVVGRAAHAIQHQLSAGDLAELRRAGVDEPFTPALWKLLLSCVPESWTAGPERDEKERRWAALFAGMAMTAGLHEPSVPLGCALAEAGWSELRFVRLMRERGDALAEGVRRMAAHLAAKGQKADWTGLAHLVLDQEGEWAERRRRAIARDYYRIILRQERKQSE